MSAPQNLLTATTQLEEAVAAPAAGRDVPSYPGRQSVKSPAQKGRS